MFFYSYTKNLKRLPDPVSATFYPGGHYGLVSEKLDLSIDDYFDKKYVYNFLILHFNNFVIYIIVTAMSVKKKLLKNQYVLRLCQPLSHLVNQ